MLTFQLKGGLGAAITLAERIKLWSVRHLARPRPQPAVLLPHRPVRRRGALPVASAQKARIREWTGDGIVRASVGLETPADLIADLDQALRGARRSKAGWTAGLPLAGPAVEIGGRPKDEFDERTLCVLAAGGAPLGPRNAARTARARVRAGPDHSGSLAAGWRRAREVPDAHGRPVHGATRRRAGPRAGHPGLVREQPQQRLLRRAVGCGPARPAGAGRHAHHPRDDPRRAAHRHRQRPSRPAANPARLVVGGLGAVQGPALRVRPRTSSTPISTRATSSCGKRCPSTAATPTKASTGASRGWPAS